MNLKDIPEKTYEEIIGLSGDVERSDNTYKCKLFAGQGTVLSKGEKTTYGIYCCDGGKIFMIGALGFVPSNSWNSPFSGLLYLEDL